MAKIKENALRWNNNPEETVWIPGGTWDSINYYNAPFLPITDYNYHKTSSNNLRE